MTAIIPVNISFVSWANQLRNSFPAQDIPQIFDEKKWQVFPVMLKSNRCFENSYIPDTGNYTDWRVWASQFLLSIGA